jgi:DNA-binding GntR family transcriptional regulator
LQKLAARVDAMSVCEQSLYLPAHEKLHRRIAQGARCAALSMAIEKTHALASTWYCVAREPSDQAPARRHQHLIEMLISGRPEDAAEAMREHVNCGMENAMERLKPYFRLRKAFGRTYYRSERRQKLQIIHPSAWN